MAERRRGNAGGGALSTEWPAAQLQWRKRRHGSPGGSPRGCGGRSYGAGGSSAKSGRWSRAALAEKVAEEVGVEYRGPGEAPEVEAEPVLSLDGALVRRSGRIPAVQSGGTAELCGVYEPRRRGLRGGEEDAGVRGV